MRGCEGARNKVPQTLSRSKKIIEVAKKQLGLGVQISASPDAAPSSAPRRPPTLESSVLVNTGHDRRLHKLCHNRFRISKHCWVEVAEGDSEAGQKVDMVPQANTVKLRATLPFAGQIKMRRGAG